LAALPACLIGPFIGKWSDASTGGKVILAATALWMLGVIFVGGYLLFRAIFRASRQPFDWGSTSVHHAKLDIGTETRRMVSDCQPPLRRL